MFVLINVFSSDCAAPYIASIQKFNTITIAQKAMETLSKGHTESITKHG